MRLVWDSEALVRLGITMAAAKVNFSERYKLLNTPPFQPDYPIVNNFFTQKLFVFNTLFLRTQPHACMQLCSLVSGRQITKSISWSVCKRLVVPFWRLYRKTFMQDQRRWMGKCVLLLCIVTQAIPLPFSVKSLENMNKACRNVIGISPPLLKFFASILLLWQNCDYSQVLHKRYLTFINFRKFSRRVELIKKISLRVVY